MLGAIIGDIIGSYYEYNPTKSKDFVLFPVGASYTDDTIMTIAIYDAILNKVTYEKSLKYWGIKYPNVGYGIKFRKWLNQIEAKSYNSYGNGAAMRVSPIGWMFDDESIVLEEAKNCTVVSHNNIEAIKGAQSVALAILLARRGLPKIKIKNEITKRFGYNLNRSLSEIRPLYKFEVSCQKSVPEAIISFLESIDFEDAIRNAVSLGGDSDTQACIAGAIAEAFYKYIPKEISVSAIGYLDDSLLHSVKDFLSNNTIDKYGCSY